KKHGFYKIKTYGSNPLKMRAFSCIENDDLQYSLNIRGGVAYMNKPCEVVTHLVTKNTIIMKIYLLKRKGQGKSRKVSLYLVYHYSTNQKREYEFLDLFLYKNAKTNLEKDHNKETLTLAETIKAQKIIDSQSRAHGIVSNVRGKIG